MCTKNQLLKNGIKSFYYTLSLDLYKGCYVYAYLGTKILKKYEKNKFYIKKSIKKIQLISKKSRKDSKRHKIYAKNSIDT